jgi:hypothetical protein
MPAPYKIADNEDSFLDATDLVFVDAVSTGYSRPMPGQSPAQFHGIIQDANYFADFIYQYLTRNERWDSKVSDRRELWNDTFRRTLRRSAGTASDLSERNRACLFCCLHGRQRR